MRLCLVGKYPPIEGGVSASNVWSSLFEPLPFGDPYIALFAAMMICYAALKIIAPSNRVY